MFTINYKNILVNNSDDLFKMRNNYKHVLIDLERLRYPNSGIANVFKNLVQGLVQITIPNSIKVSLFGPENLKELNTCFSIVERKALHKFLPFYSFKYHIVHTSHQLSSYFHYKKSGQKKVVTLHDLNFMHEVISEKKYKKELNKVQKNIGNADVIVCISEFAKQDLISHKNLFMLKKMPQIKVVYNGINFPDNQKKYDLGDYSFLKKKKYILNIGVLFAKKNQLSIIKMLPFIEEDLVLVVSSQNSTYKNLIESEIQKLKVGPRIHFCYNITDHEKWALIQNCQAMCHPSIAEGFGIPPIEAMHFGKPVFLSDKTSLPEIGGEVAFYFKSFETEKMVDVYKKGMQNFSDNSSQMIEQLKIRASEFDYKLMAKEYLKIYERLS